MNLWEIYGIALAVAASFIILAAFSAKLGVLLAHDAHRRVRRHYRGREGRKVRRALLRTARQMRRRKHLTSEDMAKMEWAKGHPEA